MATFFMGLVLQKASSLAGFGSRVGFVVLAGMVGVVLSDLGPPVWYNFPWSPRVAIAIFHVTGWLLAGLALARFVRP